MVILTSFPPPTEGIKVEQPNTEAHVGNRRFGNGTLYIAESRLSWMGSNGRGFSLEYPAISLHAVSRDHRVYPQECLYMMIDAKLDDSTTTSDTPNPTEDADEDEGLETDDRDDITEIRFIPEDRGVLDALFHAMSECQTLHPDPADSSSDDGEDQDEAYNDDDNDEDPNDTSGQNGTVTGGNGDAGSNGQRGTRTTGEPMDTSQFEDADVN